MRWLRRVASASGWLAKSFVSVIGLREVFALAGLGMIFHGLWSIDQSAAFIVVGVALFALGIKRSFG